MKPFSLLLVIIAAMFVAPITSVKADDDIPIFIEDGGSNQGGPIFHAPARIPIICVFNKSVSSLFVLFHYNLGAVSVEIENQTTGEYYLSNVDATAGLMIFPVSGNSGRWRISFMLTSNVFYYGEFEI